MEPLTILYLFYTFIAFYFLSLHILIYVQNKRQLYQIIKPDKERPLSIVIPCFNEEESIAATIQAHLDSDYAGLKKIIISDDCSTDNSPSIIKEFAKKHKIKIH